MPHGAGATLEEPPRSRGPRTASNPSGDRPCCYYGSLPVSNGRGLFTGRSHTKHQLRSPTARMTHDNLPLRPRGGPSFRAGRSGSTEERTKGRTRAGTSNATKKRNHRLVREQATLHLSGRRGRGVSRGSRRGRRGRRRLRGRQKRTTPRRGSPRERRGATRYHPSPFPWKRRLRNRHTFL